MNAKSTKTENKPAAKPEENVAVVANINGVNVADDTKIEYVDNNPKRAGSAAHQRFEKYMSAKTVAEFLKLGGLKADLRYDANKGFVKITK